MATWLRTSATASAAALLVLFGCNEAAQAPPANQADALAALLVLDEALREVQQAGASQSELSELERDPDVIYVPTPEPVVDLMLEMAEVEANDVVYDLGCGDGRIVVRAAERFGVKAWGFDIDPERVAEARANVEAAGVEDLVTIEQADIFTLDLSPASVITLYLLPELNVRLIPQLQELAPGSRIVSHDFDIEGVDPLERATLDVAGDPEPHQVYLWQTPLTLPDPEPAEPEAGDPVDSVDASGSEGEGASEPRSNGTAGEDTAAAPVGTPETDAVSDSDGRGGTQEGQTP